MILLGGAVMLTAGSACGDPAVRAEGASVPLRIHGSTLRAHVVDTPESREHGLMGVTQLEPDEGMIFVYPDEAPRYYWMKDTPTALSIAFLDARGAVVSVSDMKPFDTSLTPSAKPAMYAIEANVGWFVTHAVVPGDTFVGLPAPARR